MSTLNKLWTRAAVVGLVLAVATIGIHLAGTMPGLFGSQNVIGGVIFLQVLIASIWKFRQTFFAFLMIAFTGAGMDVPSSGTWATLRWAVLVAGAIAGFVIFMHDRRRQFGVMHLIAFCCVLGAFVSASVSAFPKAAFLKAFSLLLLFLFVSSGGRLAILGREKQFLKGLLFSCEAVVYLSAIAYFIVHLEIWGNPNSLSLVMGVVVAPVLLWGSLISSNRIIRWRYAIGSFLAIILMFFGLSRAAVIASFISMGLLLIVARKSKLLIPAAMVAMSALALAALWNPSALQSYGSESAATLLYKGHQNEGVMGSRLTPWQDTVRTIRQHPWFGTGFGTSSTGFSGEDVDQFSSNSSTNREHGSSYLMIFEWVGLIGILPFMALFVLLIARIARIVRGLYKAKDLSHPAVPIVLVLLAALIHAGFEDWLFAVGYYLTVLFWTFAFMLIDLDTPVPSRASQISKTWRVDPTVVQMGATSPGQ